MAGSPDDREGRGPKRPATRRFERPAPAQPAGDDDEATEPLPAELAAFARNPRDAEKLLGRPRRREVTDPNEETEELRVPPGAAGKPRPPRPDKAHQPIQAMRPSDVGGSAGRDEARLARLLEVNKAINNERDLGKLLDMIMDAAVEVSRARRGFLVLWDRGEMQVVRARNIERGTISSPETSISRHLIREAIDRRETVVTARAATERDEYASATSMDLKSVAVSPLMSRGRVLGAIYLDEPDRVGVFQDDDIRSLEAFSDQAAIALQNARYVAELETRMESQRLRLRRVEAEVRRRDEDDVRRFGNLVTKSPKLKRVFELLARVAETAFPVIIQGESGTGKELLAKAIHYSSDRREQPFVPMNCAAVPETLLDSELFGYQAGAFTGAVRGHRGLFEQADKGTLFLDEIEEMSPAMQGKLLRVLQEGEVRRVGGKATVKVDVRVIAATNRDIQEMVERGEFRRDLYYRLNVIPVTIPPLRERLEDLPSLVEDLLGRLAEANQQPPQVDPDAFEALRRFNWPGNIRELENELKRLLALGFQRIRLVDLDGRITSPERRGGQAAPPAGAADPNGESGALPTLNIKELEKITIERALQASNGNKTHAAKLLGLSRRGLLKKLERYRAEGERLSGDEAVGDDEAVADDGDDD
ncbi:MAG: sigma 54-interacting transcriptional regulator [Planctomycetota bacterium]|nr:sigma 54-interacting transcriptional regulator [Planctomycetota bacterium]